MQRSTIIVLAAMLVGGALVPESVAQTRILQYAPDDAGVAIPKATLDQYLRDMDRDNLATLRMIEGGKFNVNIRRIRDSETALAHPNTIDLWVVIEGSGTLTTGGRIENSQIVDGRSYPLKVGDVVFIPNGTPHGVSGVDGSITWLNIRWDTDWPEEAPLRAGNYQRGATGGGFRPHWYAGGAAIYMPKETVEAFIDQTMATTPGGTVKMVEGGHFNVNIRTQVEAPGGESHPNTIDTWVVLRGGGTQCTGFEQTETDRWVEGTGECTRGGVGDVFFIPPGVTHGWREVEPAAIWLNVRWDTNWAYQFPTGP